MIRTLLSGDVKKKVERVLPGNEGAHGRTAFNDRWLPKAVLWIGRTSGR